jgi:signal transduction histidine kinase
VAADATEIGASYDELRAGFAAAISHELRTPLARLLGVVESALLPGADIRAIVGTVTNEIAVMAELIDDVLLISQLEQPGLILGGGGAPAVDVLRQTAVQVASEADAARTTIVVAGDRDVVVPVRESMFRAVARNLMDNVIRYAGPGATLHITVRAEQGGVVLEASDNGVGVPPEALPRLFERFYRADPARQARGSGLGLAIVKHIAIAAGGRVWATDSPGGGLTIRCIFPNPQS